MAECEGKVALVTGGTSGIGRETSILFARKGARVVVAGRREIEGKETIDLIRRAGGEGIFVRADVSRASEVEALVEKTVAAFGGLDYAFNNAGIEGHWVPIVEQTEEEWDQTIDINLKGTWLCLKYELRQMLTAGPRRRDRQQLIHRRLHRQPWHRHLFRQQARCIGADQGGRD